MQLAEFAKLPSSTAQLRQRYLNYEVAQSCIATPLAEFCTHGFLDGGSACCQPDEAWGPQGQEVLTSQSWGVARSIVVQTIGHCICTFPPQVFVLSILLLLWNSDIDFSKDPMQGSMHSLRYTACPNCCPPARSVCQGAGLC